MTALSILVPNELAQDSLLIAKQMHISRSQFIRIAIENEIKSFMIKKEQDRMVSGFKALKKNRDYLVELDEIAALDTPLKEEDESWWTEQ